jgi:biotin synthase
MTDGTIDRDEALALFELPLPELAARADRARREGGGGSLEVCSIVNAKSGRCGEDCRFCAQSARWRTGASEYPLMGAGEIVAAARRARELGAGRFGVVTSGRRLSAAEVERVAAAVRAVREETGLEPCASLGSIGPDDLARLRDAGLARYHHNIEASPAHFGNLVTTHAFAERVATARAAVEAGLSLCSGGIIGAGESREDRVDMGLAVRDLGADSVPVNVLVPVPGTPLEGAPPLSAAEVLRTVAVFRLLMPGRNIKLAAGRESALGDFQGMAFMSGANGILVGGYLTRPGRSVEDDLRLVAEVRAAWVG